MNMYNVHILPCVSCIYIIIYKLYHISPTSPCHSASRAYLTTICSALGSYIAAHIDSASLTLLSSLYPHSNNKLHKSSLGFREHSGTACSEQWWCRHYNQYNHTVLQTCRSVVMAGIHPPIPVLWYKTHKCCFNTKIPVWFLHKNPRCCYNAKPHSVAVCCCHTKCSQQTGE